MGPFHPFWSGDSLRYTTHAAAGRPWGTFPTCPLAHKCRSFGHVGNVPHEHAMTPLRIKHNQRPFVVARDDAGVPNIEASTWLEALYGLGYLHAMDRSTQMLFARAMARGRSAELIANRPELLETDR